VGVARVLPLPGAVLELEVTLGKRRPGRPAQQELRTLHGAFPDEELDLHGLTAREAEFRVRAFVDRWARSQPGAVLRIVTGKGAGSAGVPVLRPLVLDLLNDELALRVAEWAVDSGGGAYLVRVR
jgi:DNA-nicking Smr family endonuclease